MVELRPASGLECLVRSCLVYSYLPSSLRLLDQLWENRTIHQCDISAASEILGVIGEATGRNDKASGMCTFGVRPRATQSVKFELLGISQNCDRCCPVVRLEEPRMSSTIRTVGHLGT